MTSSELQTKRTTQMALLKYELVQPAVQQSSLQIVAKHVFWLMKRNMSSDGFVFADPHDPGHFSRPGCIIAAPSYPEDLTTANQDYVFHWTRNAAVAAMELAAYSPKRNSEGVQALIDYVNFAQICQNSGAPTVGHACYTIEGQPRPWSEQSDGPALETLAILLAFPQLDTPTQAIATTVIGTNIDYLLDNYQNPTTNLWEERDGHSFFARSVQLRCFQELRRNTYGLPVPPATANAIAWLKNALQDHWNGVRYVTILSPSSPGEPPAPSLPPYKAYDPNIDIVMGSVYGAIPCTDTKLLATAGQLRRQWTDSSFPTSYEINVADRSRGIGPMLGRYPSDSYDGDTRAPVPGGHPWPVCTCNFAELYYGLANAIVKTQTVPFDSLSEDFFSLIEVDASTPRNEVITSLRKAGDKMLSAIVFHSDYLELGEQFDGTTGYGKGVRNSTWSYAAFLSAVRVRTGQSPLGLAAP